jgi:excisionase family DNA binding protein
MDQDTDRLLTVDDVAQKLRVSKAAVYRWVEDGRLHARKAGALLRFRAADVETFLEGRLVSEE